MTSVTSGRRCCALLTKSGPLGSLVKTLLVSPLWSKEGYSLTWEARRLCSRKVTTFTDMPSGNPLPSNEFAENLSTQDIPSSRCLFRLRLSERPTGETGSSSSPELWPTPMAVDVEHRQRVEELVEAGATDMYSRANGDRRPNGLMDYVHFKGLLLTPTAVMTKEEPERMRESVCVKGYKNGTKYGSLESQISYDPRFKGLLKTPSAFDVKTEQMKSASKTSSTGSLAQELQNGYAEKRGLLLPTPTAIEGVKWTNTYNPSSQMGQSLSAMAGSMMLPTPQVTDAGSPLTAEQKKKYVEKWAKKGIVPSASYQLRQQAAEGLLPTPTARDFKNPSSPDGERIARKQEQGYTIELNDLAPMGMLPTPRANNMTDLNMMNPAVADRDGGRLEGVIAAAVQDGMFPTPSARDWKGKTNPGTVKEGSGCVYGETLPDTIGRLTEDSSPESDGASSRLSPLFTEEMMGFPFLWTTLPFLRSSGARSL